MNRRGIGVKEGVEADKESVTELAENFSKRTRVYMNSVFQVFKL